MFRKPVLASTTDEFTIKNRLGVYTHLFGYPPRWWVRSNAWSSPIFVRTYIAGVITGKIRTPGRYRIETHFGRGLKTDTFITKIK